MSIDVDKSSEVDEEAYLRIILLYVLTEYLNGYLVIDPESYRNFVEKVEANKLFIYAYDDGDRHVLSLRAYNEMEAESVENAD